MAHASALALATMRGESSRADLDPRRWLGLAVVLTAAFLGVLDFFIVNVSIPAIQANLGATFAQVQLMIAAYGLAYAVCLITGGRLGDLYGRKRMFALGVAGFTLASALCGLAPSPGALVGARALQGTAAALMFPQVLSIIHVTFPAHERHIAFGAFGIVMGCGSFSGNVLGGLLVQADLFGLSWRPIFLVNLPVGLLALLAFGPLLRESRSPTARQLDLGGVGIATLALLLLVYPLVQGREFGWPPWAFGCLAASVLVFCGFILYELRVSARGGSSLVELALFRNRAFVAGLLATLAYCGGLSAFFLTVTIFLQDGLGFSAERAGLTFAPFAVGYLIAASLAVKLTPWLGSRLIGLGAALMMVGLAALIALAHAGGTALSELPLVSILLVYGTGQGFASPTLVSAALSGIPGRDAGSASGVLTTVQQVALAIGVAVIGSIYFAVLGSRPQARDFAAALATALLCNIVLLLATFMLVFRLPRDIASEAVAQALEV